MQGVKRESGMSNYILGLSQSTENLIGEIEDVINGEKEQCSFEMDSMEGSAVGWLGEGSYLMEDAEQQSERDSERDEGSFTIWNKEETAIMSLKQETGNLREEIVNIQNVLDLEYVEKVASFERVGKLLSELKKNQDVLLQKLVLTNNKIDRVENHWRANGEMKAKEMFKIWEKQLFGQLERNNAQWEVRFKALNKQWEDRFVTLEGKVGRETRKRIRNSSLDPAGVQFVQKAQQLQKINGRDNSKKEIKSWIEQARICANQLNIVGLEAVEYVRESLLEPARTRIRHANPKSLDEMEDKLLQAYTENRDELDKKRALWCAEQDKDEDSWAFLDRINELEEDIEGNVNHSKEREIMKCMIFEKGLRNRKIASELKQKIADRHITTLEKAGGFVHEKSCLYRDRKPVVEKDRSKIYKKENKVIRCWLCGQQGHVSHNCSQKNPEARGQGQIMSTRGNQRSDVVEGENNGFSGKCWTCGEEGHPFFKCHYEVRKDDNRQRGKGNQVVREVDIVDSNDDLQGNL